MQLSAVARDAVADPASEVLISIAALWELTLKQATRKLTLTPDLETMLAD